MNHTKLTFTTALVLILLAFNSTACASAKKIEYTESKPGYGEGGGSGAAKLPEGSNASRFGQIDFSDPSVVTKTGKVKIKTKGKGKIYSLKAEDSKTYSLDLTRYLYEHKDFDAATLKNKKVNVTGSIQEDNPVLIKVLLLDF